LTNCEGVSDMKVAIICKINCHLWQGKV